MITEFFVTSLALENWGQKYCQTLSNRPLLAMNSLYNKQGQWPVPMVLVKNIHPVCCKDNYLPKGKFKLFNSLFHSVYLAAFFCRALAVGRIITSINAVSCTSRDGHSRSLSCLLVLFTFACIACLLPNQNKRTRFLYLGDAQIISNGVITLLWQLRCHCNPDLNNFLPLSNTAVVVIFQIFVNRDVIYAQTWEVLTLKNPTEPP